MVLLEDKEDEMNKIEKPDERICPICGHSVAHRDYFCRSCGWILGEEELGEDDNSQDNGVSKRQYRELLSSIKEEDPGFVYEKDAVKFENMRQEFMKANGLKNNRWVGFYGLPCPVCGEEMIRNYYDICSVCGWELDEVQMDDPDFWGGANILSLNDSKKVFRSFREKDPSYRWKDDSSILHKKEDEMLPLYEEKEKSSSQ